MNSSFFLFLLLAGIVAAFLCSTGGLSSVLGYYASVNAAVTDMAAITTNETNFSARNGHWIFTEQYDLVAAFAAGATMTQAQLFDATYNAVNIPQLYSVNLGITPLTNPNMVDFRDQPWPLPTNEEFQFQSNNAGTADQYGLLFIVPSGSNPWMQAPPLPTLGAPRVFALVTATVALTTQVWSPFVTLSFSNTLKGGVYQVNGAHWIVAHALAYRHSFPKSPLYQSRKLTPGSLVENAYGNVPLKQGRNWLGVHGWFNYFEPFQVSFLGTTSETSATYTGILDMTYMGNNYPAGFVPG
jgi:hypothetical protein